MWKSGLDFERERDVLVHERDRLLLRVEELTIENERLRAALVKRVVHVPDGRNDTAATEA